MATGVFAESSVTPRNQQDTKEYLNHRGTEIRVFQESERGIQGELRGKGARRQREEGGRMREEHTRKTVSANTVAAIPPPIDDRDPIRIANGIASSLTPHIATNSLWCFGNFTSLPRKTSLVLVPLAQTTNVQSQIELCMFFVIGIYLEEPKEHPAKGHREEMIIQISYENSSKILQVKF